MDRYEDLLQAVAGDEAAVKETETKMKKFQNDHMRFNSHYLGAMAEVKKAPMPDPVVWNAPKGTGRGGGPKWKV